MYPLKQSTAISVPFYVHDTSGVGVTGLVTGDFTKRISKNGGAFAAMTVTVTELENGWYSLPLDTSHTDTLGLLSISLAAAGAVRANLQFRVFARAFDDLAFPTVSGRSLDVGTTGGAGIDWANVKAPTTSLNLSGTTIGALTANNDKTGYSLTALESLNVHSGTAQSGSTSTTLNLAAGASATDQIYRSEVLKLYGGTGAGQARVIVNYDGTTKIATVDRAWLIAPDNTTTYAVLSLDAPCVDVGCEVLAASVSAPVTVGTNNDKSSYSLTAGSLATSTFAAGAIDSTVFAQSAADRIWSSASRTLTALSTSLAQSVWDVLESAISTANSIGVKVKTALPAVLPGASGGLPTTDANNAVKVQSGTGTNQINLSSGNVMLTATTHTGATIPTVTTTNNIGAGGITSASFAASAIDATAFSQGAADRVKLTTLSELAQGVPSITPTLGDALMAWYMEWRNQTTSTADTKSVRNDAGTVVMKFSLSDDGTTFTKGKVVSGP